MVKMYGGIFEMIQLRWTHWNHVCDFIGDIISEKNPARKTDLCSDNCGEVPPYIEFTLPSGQVVQHGDWLIKGVDGKIYALNPKAFKATHEMI